jgi:hypothetical protein
MAGFEIQYAGVRLIGIHTDMHDCEPVYDDSRTDQMFNKITIAGSTIVNTAVLVAQNKTLGAIGTVAGGSAAEICKNLTPILGENRKRFVYIQDGTIMHDVDGSSDCDNGPRVKFSLKPMGANSVRITFTVEIAKVVCGGTVSPVLNNRWAVIDVIDENIRTTRTWRGKLRTSNAVHNPQAFREMCFPALSDGFQRVAMHFTGELNALELGYEIVDRQLLGDAPPGVALNMNGTHTETLNRNGSSSIGEVYVRLDGQPGTDKQVLIEQCMRIINSKVQADKFRNATNWQWLELIITDYFGPNVCAVDARARVQRAIEGEGSVSLRLGNMLLETLGRSLDLGGNYVRYRMEEPSPYPCTTLGLLSAHLQSPCVNDHAIPRYGEHFESEHVASNGTETDTHYVTHDPDGTPVEIDSPGYSDDQTVAMYTHCNVEWIVDIDEGTIQLPLGDLQPASDATSAVVRLHAPVAKLTMKVAAERIGDWPRIPDRKKFTDAAGIQYIPLKYTPNFRPPEYQGDGSKLHVIDIEAKFAMSRAPGPNEFVVPSLPWDDLEGGFVASEAFTPLG